MAIELKSILCILLHYTDILKRKREGIESTVEKRREKGKRDEKHMKYERRRESI